MLVVLLGSMLINKSRVFTYAGRQRLKTPTNGKRFTLCMILAGVTLLLTACQPEFALWVVPNSSPSSVVFGLSKSRNSDGRLKVNSIAVFTCELVRKNRGADYPNPEYAVWYATSSDVSAPATNTLSYGKEGFGLHTTHGPESLQSPGCYVVLVYARDEQGYMGTAKAGFKIQKDGHLIEMSDNEYKDLFTQ